LLGIRRWLRQRQTLTSASNQLVALQCSKGVASNALVVWRLTHDVSVRWRWRQQSAEEAKALGSIRHRGASIATPTNTFVARLAKTDLTGLRLLVRRTLGLSSLDAPDGRLLNELSS
jgi:hypothetical protein